MRHSRTIAVLAAFSLAACVQEPPSQMDADAFAKRFLGSIQAQSIAERREFCGYFFVDQRGQIAAIEPVRGTFASCNLTYPVFTGSVFASYHTHGAYGPNYDNEVPSVLDLNSDIALGINGYISTPGGRVWRVNADTQDAVQLCGLGCLTADPQFVPFEEQSVLPRFTLGQLEDREAN